MKIIADKIRDAVGTAKPALLAITPEEAGRKIRPDAWSKKEILGHLIDSATNNHQRFVRAALNGAQVFPPYTQNEWVKVQHYNEAEWFELIQFFSLYNLHLSRIIENLPDEVLKNQCNIGKAEMVPLEFVIKDYLRHLQHHLDKILEPQTSN